ncbi:hypothetical protein GH714_000703 [Hevea brasiliensis]|uniref:RNase H type-1 domain-containing protein n=1 Tax=Hevea brasiliensis TaxID=3981 RepID=A0A6A6LVE6_HEVBR|nr:hypothetical protein GH714_000703 [Hevea brasiliensis]
MSDFEGIYVVDSCDICLLRVESGLHVLRDCVVASYIWKHFVPRNDWAEFFSSNTDLWNWVIQNLSKCDHEVQNMHWPFLLASYVGLYGTITTVSWTCPPDNVFKLNTDGSLPNLGGIACGGGLIRDSNGRWFKGFKVVFGKTSVLGAELCLSLKVTFSHVLRDANYAADWLAGHLHTHDFGVEVLDTPPVDLVPWLMHDLVGVAYFRSV